MKQHATHVAQRTIATLLVALCTQVAVTPSFAQGSLKAEVHGVVMEHMRSSDAARGFQPELRITDAYMDKQMGLTHVYAQQEHSGVPVYNVISVFALKEGKVVYAKEALVRDIAAIASPSVPAITAHQAIQAAASHLGKPLPQHAEELPSGRASADRLRYNVPGLSASPVEVRLVYLPVGEAVRLAWDVSMEMRGEAHWWNIRVDAHTGEYLEKNDYTVECNFSHAGHETHAGRCASSAHASAGRASAPAPVPPASGSAYRAFALPAEAPTFGSRSLISNPADAIASPFGWHDTDGAAGAEYTITRGNNAYAYEDQANANAPGYSPAGGAGLNFDFPLNLSANPVDNMDAALTNMFYATNAVHDILYRHGFDEAAGNFQHNNYGRGGFGLDHVRAEGFDGSGMNNANFNTPPDGYHPRMQMYLWESVTPECNALNITSGLFTGGMTTGRAAFTAFGNVTAELILVQDAVAPVTDGCTAFTNSVTGKIVLIDRGTCTFVIKAQQAVAAGAVGVIIANNVAGAPNGMTGTPVQGIPVVSVSQADGNLLKAALLNGPVTANIVTCEASLFDSNFDNGIIAHEYGHGLSNRLTGGPSVTGCLSNQEQAGEGWSDWVALMLTLQPGDQGTDARGIGTYALGQPTSGLGIRRFPYSTDMGINPLTYGDMPTSSGVHARGEIWCAATWDLSWLLMDEFGFSNDPTVATAGNNIAMRLVLGGLKLQPCSPGFIDGRNAILAADELLYGGAHRCKIWEAFARRGMGFSASQGSSNATNDQTVAFDTPSYCAPCAGTPDPTTAAAAPAVFCGDGAVSLSLTGLVEREGLTYQWHSSSDNAAFDPMDVATGKTHQATPDADTYYRCTVTCSHSGQSAVSGSVGVTYVPGTAGGTVSGPSAGQIGTELTYTVSGHSGSLQWQSASSPSGPFANIPSANGNSYSFTPAVAGTVYLRAMATGSGCDAFSNVVSTSVTVVGDNVCDAIPLTVGVLSATYSNTGATIESNEPLPPISADCSHFLSSWCSVPSHSLWFQFVAPASSVTISFNPANWDSQLALWWAETCADMRTADRMLIAANEDHTGASPFHSQLTALCLVPGQTYFLQVDGYGNDVSNNIRIQVSDLGDATTWYADADGDSFGNPAVSIQSCGQVDGFVANADDCDDTDDAVGSDCLQWSGATNTDWGTASNWNPAQVPAATDDVVIRAAPVNQPEVNAAPATPALCDRLMIDAGASLKVKPGKALTVHGALNNEGAVTTEADENGIGSLITHGSISGSGTFIAQQYLKGAGGATPNGVFHYVSTPVAGATAAVYDLASGNKLWAASETGQNYPQITNGATALNAGQGYVVRMGATDVYSLNGTTFNTGPVALNGLTRLGPGTNAGYNLIGNPYPSSVSWDDAITDNMQPSIWYRTHTAGEAMTFDVYNAQSGIGTGNNRFGVDADGLVPPGQAFWVRVVDGESLGSVTFNNTMRSHGTQAQLYKLAGEEGTVRMRLIGNNGSDEAIVHFTSEAQDGPDAYDSHKMWGAAALAQVYTTAGTDTVAINGLFSTATNPVVDLGVRLPSAGDYSFHAHSITLSENVWLEDRLLNNFQHLNEDPTYGFTSEAGNHGNRFALHFGALVGVGRGVACNACTQVFAADGMVNILLGAGNTKGAVTILDMMGRTVQTAVLNGSRTAIATDVPTGVYLVRVETKQDMETKRVMLR